MQIISTTLITALLLVLLKAVIKLYVHNQPDGIDYIKAVSVMPVDITFLVLGLLIKHVSSPDAEVELTAAYIVGYLIVSVFVTYMWRLGDDAIAKSKFAKFWLVLLPINLSAAGLSLNFALSLLK